MKKQHLKKQDWVKPLPLGIILGVIVMCLSLFALVKAEPECKNFEGYNVKVCLSGTDGTDGTGNGDSNGNGDEDPDGGDADGDGEPDDQDGGDSDNGDVDIDPKTDLWRPGHYLLNKPLEALKHPELKGGIVDVFWRDIEPKKGDYDTKEIDSILKKYEGTKKLLFTRFEWKAFNTRARQKLCAPDYIFKINGVHLRYYDEVERFKHKGHKIWKCLSRTYREDVRNHIKRVAKYLGNRYNMHPNFGGFVLPETAGEGDGPGNSLEKRYKAVIELAIAFQRAAPGKLTLYNTNWWPKGLSFNDLLRDFEKHGIGASGPDLMTGRLSSSQKLHPKYKGRIPLGVENQRAPTVAKNPNAAWKWARDKLKVDYIFWAAHHKKAPWRLKEDIIPVIKNDPIKSKCPSSLNCK